ncbi:MAG: FAD-dependent oxidoreductase, partial [Bacilli bacterium]|nr:FAD-dependent oxidoreductase [Bacilli bacterium]
GPAGLSAATLLAREGHEVVVYEKEAKAGGYLRYGIPSYRLPEEVLDKEIARIAELGVAFRFHEEVKDLSVLEKEYDAVIVGDGYGLGKTLPLFEGNRRAITAVEFLKKVKTRPVRIPEHVLIIGGGDVAMDVASTCKKLGAAQVSDVVYETFPEFKASKAELELARKENVSIYDGFIPVSATRGGVVKFRHRHQPIELKLKAGLIVLAIGQARLEGGLGEPKDKKNVFYCGDVSLEGDKTVVYAVRTGKEAAIKAMAYLGGK